MVTIDKVYEIWKELMTDWSANSTPIDVDKYTLLLIVGQYVQVHNGAIQEFVIPEHPLSDQQVQDIKIKIANFDIDVA